MAVLATMLARFRQFRHILIFERRNWSDRLVFALAIGLPLMAGVTARLLLNYNAADLTLEGAFLAGLIAGPYAGAHRRPARRGSRADRRRVHRAAVRRRLRVCRRRPARGRAPRKRSGSSRRSSSSTCGSTSGRWCGRLEPNWQLVLLARAGRARTAAPGARHALRRSSGSSTSSSPVALDDGARRSRHGAGRRDADQDLEQRAHRTSAAGAGKAAARGEDRSAQEPDQSALPVQHAGVDLIAHPVAARHRAHAHHQAVGPAAPADPQPPAFRHAARGTRIDRRVPRHRGRAVRAEAAGAQGDQPRHDGRRSSRA